MKPSDVKTSTYIGFGVENNYKNPKFKVGDHVRILILKYNKNFAKDDFPYQNLLQKK